MKNEWIQLDNLLIKADSVASVQAIKSLEVDAAISAMRVSYVIDGVRHTIEVPASEEVFKDFCHKVRHKA